MRIGNAEKATGTDDAREQPDGSVKPRERIVWCKVFDAHFLNLMRFTLKDRQGEDQIERTFQSSWCNDRGALIFLHSPRRDAPRSRIDLYANDFCNREAAAQSSELFAR